MVRSIHCTDILAASQSVVLTLCFSYAVTNQAEAIRFSLTDIGTVANVFMKVPDDYRLENVDKNNLLKEESSTGKPVDCRPK